MLKNLSDHRKYKALLERDSSFEGVFIAIVRTTGIFCRPTCRARKPKRENVIFVPTAKDALLRGFRPCKICCPMEPAGAAPDWIKIVLERAGQSEGNRLQDWEIRKLGQDPNRVRRWFKANHNMTFQTYLRSLRLGQAFRELSDGKPVIHSAMGNGYDSLSGFTSAFGKHFKSKPSKTAAAKPIHLKQILTPLGPMLAGATDNGICLLEFTDRRMLEREMRDLTRKFKAPFIRATHQHLDRLERQLQEYFTGRRKVFELPLSSPGTDFQRKVWTGLQKIPYGETRSYRAQAALIQKPRAVRAVANANGQNRIAIVIPCHRVIGTNGKLVGYGGGLARKKFLLELESKHQD